MKTNITWIALAVAISGTAITHAQEGRPERRGQRQVPEAMLKEFDKDGDGKLNDDERTAMREAMRARFEEARKKEIAEFDKDKDGKLNEEERKAANEAREAKRKALVEKYDADKDGKLSREEIQTAVKAGEEVRFLRPGGPGQRGPRGEGRPPRGERQPKPEDKKEEAKPEEAKPAE
jgi:Ca2+-binding EF-hand superfamily protein